MQTRENDKEKMRPRFFSSKICELDAENKNCLSSSHWRFTHCNACVRQVSYHWREYEKFYDDSMISFQDSVDKSLDERLHKGQSILDQTPESFGQTDQKEIFPKKKSTIFDG